MTHTAHSNEAEQAVLGAMLMDPDCFIDLVAILQPHEFFDPAHREIFQAMIELYDADRGFDLLTVTQKLNDSSRINAAGGSAYLAELTTACPTSANAERYAQIIKDKAIHRAVAVAGQAITNLAADQQLDATEVLEKAEQQILAITRLPNKSDPQTPFEIGQAAFDHYAELHEAEDPSSLCGIQTGFRDLDGYLQGLEPGDFVIIAARPGMGKSSLALDMARNVADQQGKPVTFFSLEMSDRSLLERLLAARSDVNVSKLRQGQMTEDEFQKVPAAIERLKDSPLYIDDGCDASLMNLRSKARRMKMKHGLDLLIVDYLQLIEVRDRSARENRTQEITYISRQLKILARELGCPIIALSQLSRAVETRPGNIPQLSDLRDSGSLEQDADIVLMLYREDMYEEDSSTPGVTDVYIRKHRSGPTGRVELFFDKQRTTFRPLTHTTNPAGVASGERSKMFA